MKVLKFESFDGFGGLVASADLVVDQSFWHDVVTGYSQYLIWHIDAQQPKDLFDFTTGLKVQTKWFPDLPAPNGWGDWASNNTLTIRFGDWQTGALFAHLYEVLEPDPASGNWLAKKKGGGWLFGLVQIKVTLGAAEPRAGFRRNPLLLQGFQPG